METQREFFADKTMDLANFAVSVLIFGQAVAERIRWRPFWIGLAFFWMCVVISYVLKKEDSREK